MVKKNRYITIFVWLVIAAMFIFLTLNRHSRTVIYNYHSEIWADKAGYYVYLPFAFIYHFDAALFPGSIDKKTGNGFNVDTVNKIIKTKYPYGVALLQSPFFIVTHWLAKPLGYEANGFSVPYYRAVDIAAVFYLLSGLFFLWSFLKKRYSKKLSFFVLFFITTSTNLYYYAIDETGMSHIYSFAIFAAIIWLIDFFDIKKVIHVLFITIFIALLIVVRPINVIFLLFLLLLQKDKVKTWITDIRKIKVAKTIAVLIPALIIIIVQLIYWKYASGNFFTNPYKGESFIYLSTPQIFKVWFSTNNGLFIYSPVWLLIIAGIIMMIFDRQTGGWIYLLLFFVLSYVFSSWWSWSLGCGFGHRAYIEYLTVFIMPAIFLWKKISSYKVLQSFIITILLIFTVYNLILTYVWDGCWYGGTWDYQLLWQKFLSGF